MNRFRSLLACALASILLVAFALAAAWAVASWVIGAWVILTVEDVRRASDSPVVAAAVAVAVVGTCAVFAVLVRGMSRRKVGRGFAVTRPEQAAAAASL